MTEDQIDREAIRTSIRAGQTPDQICKRSPHRRAVYLAAIEEEARLEGEFGAFEPSEEVVRYLRDNRNLRWERIAARVYGEAGKTTAAKALYDSAKGEGAAERSYTGRGRRFPAMDEDEI